LFDLVLTSIPTKILSDIEITSFPQKYLKVIELPKPCLLERRHPRNQNHFLKHQARNLPANR
jgi:hypothetical protein